jgi:hypothetical protein
MSVRRCVVIAASAALLGGALTAVTPGAASAAAPDSEREAVRLPALPELDESVKDRVALRQESIANGSVQSGPGIQAAPEDCLTISGDLVTVLRYAGPNRYETAVCVSFWTWPNHDDPGVPPELKAKAVVLARGDVFPDALAGGPLAGHAEAPLLLTPPTDLLPAVKTEIQRVLAPGGQVYLLGGPTAVSNGIRDELQAAGFTTRRLAGANRFETAIAIAEELPDTSNFFFATGRNFPDALGAGTAAATLSLAFKLDDNPDTRPFALLLTDDREMPESTLVFVQVRHDQFGGSILVTAGGAADSAAVDAFGAANLAARFVGSNRYETATEIAEGVFTDSSGELVGAGAGLSTGLNFPDALSATATLAIFAEPLLLTQQTGLSTATRIFLENHAGEGEGGFLDVFGGTTTLSNAIVNAAADAFAPEP